MRRTTPFTVSFQYIQSLRYDTSISLTPTELMVDWAVVVEVPVGNAMPVRIALASQNV
jgi:hypothetical protein